MTEYINVKIYASFDRVVDRQCRAIVREGIAIHGRLPDDKWGKYWHVVHVVSGMSLFATNKPSDARRALRFFASRRINGVSLANLPGCEVCAIAPAIADDFYHHMRAEVSNFTNILESASEIADFLACKRGVSL